MPNPHPIALRTRAVAAYEAGEGSYVAIAEQFAISVSSLLRWVARTRTTGDVRPSPKRGGWQSAIEAGVLTAVITERPDATVAEIRRTQHDRESRLLAALRLVQGEVRYTGIESGAGSHAPTRDPRR